jgi:cation transport protein ChaC
MKPLPPPIRLTPQEFEASVQDGLAGWNRRADAWLFGYGSLIWKPECEFVERRDARIHGYHRALCLWSRINRGTPERPGLVLGLDHGGSCHGVAYRIARACVPQTFRQLWEREMATGAYHPTWVPCRTPRGIVTALTFVINRDFDGYAGGLNDEQLVRVLAGSSGRYGSTAEYVRETAASLRSRGTPDLHLERLLLQLQ